MIHLALWLLSFLFVMAIVSPIILLILAAMTRKTFWLIIGILLMLASWPLMSSAHSLAIGLLIVGVLMAVPGIAETN